MSSDCDFIDDNDVVLPDNLKKNLRRKKNLSKPLRKKITLHSSDSDDIEPVLKPKKTEEVIPLRRGIREKHNLRTEQLSKLHKLRTTKGLSLPERAKVLQSESESDVDGSTVEYFAFNEHLSDREFIKSSSSESAFSNEENEQEKNTKKRVVMSEDSSDDELLLDENEKLFFEAVKTNNPPAIELMLHNNSFINIYDDKKDTALHIATKAKFTNIVKLLLDNGAKPDMVNGGEQLTALSYAAINKDLECFEMLLKVTDLNFSDKSIQIGMDGKTLLHLLVENFNNDVIIDSAKLMKCLSILRQHDTKLFKKSLLSLDDDKSTPLVGAIKSGAFQVNVYYSGTEDAYYTYILGFGFE